MGKLFRRVRLWWLRELAGYVQEDIIAAVEQRDRLVSSLAKLRGHIAYQQDRLRRINARIAALEDPKRLLDEALASRATR